MNNNINQEKNKKFKRYKSFKALTESVLSKMSDDDLKKVFIETRSFVNRGKRQKRNVRDREIDLCYIQRELQLRKMRF